MGLQVLDSTGALKTTGSGGGGGSSALLAVNSYSPGSAGSFTTTSATLADVDAANMAITVTIPANGQFLMRLTAFCDIDVNGNQYRWSLRVASSDVSGAGGTVSRNDSGSSCTLSFIVTGTPNSTVTYKWSHSATQTPSATGRIIFGPGGNDFPPATMEAFEIP